MSERRTTDVDIEARIERLEARLDVIIRQLDEEEAARGK